jgi:hypothetical protein
MIKMTKRVAMKVDEVAGHMHCNKLPFSLPVIHVSAHHAFEEICACGNILIARDEGLARRQVSHVSYRGFKRFEILGTQEVTPSTSQKVGKHHHHVQHCKNGGATHSHITRQGSSAKHHSRFAQAILPRSERTGSLSPRSKGHRCITRESHRKPDTKNPASFDAGLGGPQVNDLPHDNFSMSDLYPKKCAHSKFSGQAARMQSHLP